MANLTINTASAGVADRGIPLTSVPVGEAVTQMQPGYYKTSDGLYYKARAGGTAEESRVTVMFLTPAAANGFSVVARVGARLVIGATLTKGIRYALSATAGLICLHTDLASGNYVVDLGLAESTTVLTFDPDSKEVTK